MSHWRIERSDILIVERVPIELTFYLRPERVCFVHTPEIILSKPVVNVRFAVRRVASWQISDGAFVFSPDIDEVAYNLQEIVDQTLLPNPVINTTTHHRLQPVVGRYSGPHRRQPPQDLSPQPLHPAVVAANNASGQSVGDTLGPPGQTAYWLNLPGPQHFPVNRMTVEGLDVLCSTEQPVRQAADIHDPFSVHRQIGAGVRLSLLE